MMDDNEPVEPAAEAQRPMKEGESAGPADSQIPKQGDTLHSKAEELNGTKCKYLTCLD